MAPAHSVATRNIDEELEEFVGQFYDDPLGFVETCFPWPINGELGPDVWQAQVLTELGEAVKARAFDGLVPVLPIREAVSSGHGIGKSALIAFILIWLMSTRRNSQWTVTANTNEQLEKKTWAAVRTWLPKCLTAHWFECNSQIMYRKGARSSWFASPQSCAEENSEAFAGQHAKSSSSGYLFDEASAIPPKIWEVAEGGLTDGEPWLLAFGNCTRNTGKFHEAVFGAKRDRWVTHIIDSRNCKFANKALIAEWAEDYGEDSDFFKVRVRGLPPSADEAQYIDLERIQGAQNRVAETLADEPLIAGVDVSGGGSAWTVCRFRRGLDARFPPIRISGEKSRDRNHIVSVLAERLSDTAPGRKIDAMFVDTAFGAAVVERLHALNYRQVHEVNFGGESPDPQCANMRAFMWKKGKDWLPRGAIDKNDHRLAMDLQGPGYHLNQKNKLVLESKESMQKRGVVSPDDGDAHHLTFAQAVKAKPQETQPARRAMPATMGGTGWMR
jgi:hypothetical protein